MRNLVLAVIVGLAGLAVGAALVVLHRASEPADSALPVAAAPASTVALPPSATAGAAVTGTATAPQSVAAASPSPAASTALATPGGTPPAASAPAPAPAASDLPNVDVAPLSVHAVPDEDSSAPTVTLQDRSGRTIREIKPAEPLSPTYRPSVGPAPTTQRFAALVPPSSRATTAPMLVPPVGNSRLAAAPSTATAFFNGAASAAGATTLAIGGHSFRLFGVRVADPRDQCGLGAGDNRSCAEVAREALAQRLQHYPNVACHVPPGQRGDPAAVCTDASGTDLGGFLVAEGYALADTNQSYDYFGAEGVARSFRRGLWRYR